MNFFMVEYRREDKLCRLWIPLANLEPGGGKKVISILYSGWLVLISITGLPCSNSPSEAQRTPYICHPLDSGQQPLFPSSCSRPSNVPSAENGTKYIDAVYNNIPML